MIERTQVQPGGTRKAWEAPQITVIDGAIESGLSPGNAETAGANNFYLPAPTS